MTDKMPNARIHIPSISEKSNTFVVAPVEYENTGLTDAEAAELGNPRTMKRLTRAAALQMQLIWSGIVIGFLSALIGLTLSNTTAAVAGSLIGAALFMAGSACERSLKKHKPLIEARVAALAARGTLSRIFG